MTSAQLSWGSFSAPLSSKVHKAREMHFSGLRNSVWTTGQLVARGLAYTQRLCLFTPLTTSCLLRISWALTSRGLFLYLTWGTGAPRFIQEFI